MHPYHLIYLPEVASTNSWAKNALDEGTILPNTAIVAGTQTAGRGQLQTMWHDAPGKNLLLTLVVSPKNLAAADFFTLNEAVSLALIDALRPLVQVAIKWPNDILVGTEKLAGVLIETVVKGKFIQKAIIGIGLNVNQTQFNEGLRATSLALACGRDFDLTLLRDSLLGCLHRRLEQLHQSNLSKEYNAHLYGLNQTLRFADANGTFSATVNGVDADGALLLYLNGEQHLARYRFKEISWIF